MAAAQDGDPGALEALLLRHHDRLRTLCRRMCGNEADADDATQEALIAVVRGLSGFDGRAAFTTWAHRVATNACLDELRRRARRPAPWAETDAAVGTGTHVTGSTRRGDGTEAVAARLDLDAALAALAPEVRAAVVLRDLVGYDYAAIAGILDIPLGTVRSRISRGRARLAGLLDRGNRAPIGEHPNPDDGQATSTAGGIDA